MLMFWVFFILSVVFVEGVTELICKSLFFAPIRAAVSKIYPFFKKLLGCGYCTSVWVAPIPAAFLAFWLTGGFSLLTVPVFVLFTVVLHRLSNRFHDLGDKHLDKYYDRRYEDSQEKLDRLNKE